MSGCIAHNPCLYLYFASCQQSDSRQTPPYSPQPTAGPQSSPLSSSSPQTSLSKATSVGPQKPPAHSQVPLPLFSFPTTHPGQFHPATLTALGLLPTHQSQGQPHHPVHIPSTSWPIHGPVLTSSSATVPSPPGLKFALRSVSGNGSPTGTAGSPSSVSLNDPSIIFAQPAGRLGMGGPGREGHWHNSVGKPGSLMGNGTVVKSGIHWGTFGGTSLWGALSCYFCAFKEQLQTNSGSVILRVSFTSKI